MTVKYLEFQCEVLEQSSPELPVSVGCTDFVFVCCLFGFILHCYNFPIIKCHLSVKNDTLSCLCVCDTTESDSRTEVSLYKVVISFPEVPLCYNSPGRQGSRRCRWLWIFKSNSYFTLDFIDFSQSAIKQTRRCGIGQRESGMSEMKSPADCFKRSMWLCLLYWAVLWSGLNRSKLTYYNTRSILQEFGTTVITSS